MNKFILVTVANASQGDQQRRINVSHITDYGPSLIGSYIQVGPYCGKESIHLVTETPERIDQKIDWITDQEGASVEWTQ